MFSSAIVGGDELHAHGFVLLRKLLKAPLPVTLLKINPAPAAERPTAPLAFGRYILAL
jgi:hypothetical protein